MIGSVPYFLACVTLVSVIVSVLAALSMHHLAPALGLNNFATVIFGLAGCIVLSFASFYLLDPDPVSEFDTPVPLHWRTLTVTGFAALIWLPIYLVVHSKLARKRLPA